MDKEFTTIELRINFDDNGKCFLKFSAFPIKIMFKRFTAFYIFFFVFLMFDVCVLAQSRSFRNFDVLHYSIKTGINFDAKKVTGETTITFRPLADNFRMLKLDTKQLKVAKVIFNGVPQKFRQDQNNLFITFDKPLMENETSEILISYTAFPKPSASGGGMFFVPEKKLNGRTIQPRHIWTQGEPEDNSRWFPCYDAPDDKATSEQFITVKNGETAIANGDLIEIISNADGGKTFHYRTDKPHSTYLTSLVVGNFEKVSDQYGEVPLEMYFYPQFPPDLIKVFAKTSQMFSIFENKTGVKYPFNQYRQTLVDDFTFGGMENITATTLAQSEILSALSSQKHLFEAENLIAHELAHSWFGNLVTANDWRNLWLNEGLATFMEAVFREETDGKTAFEEMMKRNAEQFRTEYDAGIRHPLNNARARPDLTLFDATTYQKGALVVSMLREQVGEENFWKSINLYLNKNLYKNVTSEDFIQSFEQVTGQNLQWFSKQWIYQAGYPQLIISPVYNQNTKMLTFNLKQIHNFDKQTPSTFVFPFEIEITTAVSKRTEKFSVNKRTEIFTISLDGKPEKFLFNPHGEVLATAQIQPVKVLR